jgi:cell wall-associated NlpC family hydrolase
MLFFHLEGSQVRPDQLLLNTRPEIWTDELEKAFATIAMNAYPNEACACVIDGKLIELKNISNDPSMEVDLSVKDKLKVAKSQGFIHSHPDGPHYPSETDMLSQMSAKIPYGIVACTNDSCSNSIWLDDNTLSISLDNRPFVHGIFDCYSLIRAWYFQNKNVILMDFAREFDWWEDNPQEDLYLKNFEKAGFKKIPDGEAMKEGDVILMNIQSSCVSHAAIYLGNNQLIHHLRNKITKKSVATSWKKFFHTVVRYND